MKFICKELSSKAHINILRTLLLSIILTTICTLFLPTVSVEGKANDVEIKVVETSFDINKFEKDLIKEPHVKSIKNINKNIPINMKQVNGIGQPVQWIDEVLGRVNTVMESCKGKFSSLDMILMPLNLNSNQWINH